MTIFSRDHELYSAREMPHAPDTARRVAARYLPRLRDISHPPHHVTNYHNFAGTLCTDQLLFRATLKKAVLKKHRPDSGSETHALAIHCSVTPTLDPVKLP
jgi:hypothetical protein